MSYSSASAHCRFQQGYINKPANLCHREKGTLKWTRTLLLVPRRKEQLFDVVSRVSSLNEATFLIVLGKQVWTSAF